MTKEYDAAVASLGNIMRMNSLLPEGIATDAAHALANTVESSTRTRWGWSVHQNPDTWVGAFFTREDAIDDARQHSHTTFYVVSGQCPDGRSYMPDADTVIDMIGQAASDAAGDAAEDFPDVSPEAQKVLDDLLSAWSSKYLTRCSFWVSEGEPEKIVPDEPVVEDPA